MRRLHERHHVAVLSPQLGVHRASCCSDCPVPVHHAPSIDAVERFLDRQPVRAILYVNQNQQNFPAMRFADPAHVFICHGESDKDYMSSNQLKAYDRVFIAGTAARERILRKLIGFDEPRLVEVGRPQVDVDFPGPDAAPRRPHGGALRPHLGGRPCRRCATPRSPRHGPALVRSLVATRPAPGRLPAAPAARAHACRAYRAAHEEIVTVSREANRADAGAGHVVDVAGGFGWQVDAADVVRHGHLGGGLRLARDRQAAARHPAGRAAGRSCPSRAWCASCTLLDAADAGRAAEIVDAAVRHPDEMHAALVRRYFGDTTPGRAWSASSRRARRGRGARGGPRRARGGRRDLSGPE